MDYAYYASKSCLQCGNCVEVCPAYLATGELKYSPMGRLAALRQKADADSLLDVFTYCSMCKRCAYFCPLGLDVAEVTRQVRDMLWRMGKSVSYVAKVVDNFEKWGNNIGLTPRVVQQALRAAVKRVEREKGQSPAVYLYNNGVFINVADGKEERPRRPALLFPSSSDLFEFDEALRGYMYSLWRLGLDVVVSAALADSANYGYYLSTEAMMKIADRYTEVVNKVRTDVAVFGECGHGWHVFTRLVAPRVDLPVYHIHEILAEAYLKGVLRLRRVEVAKPVAYMDPCNYSRGAGPVKEPRLLLKAVVGDYLDWGNPKESLCCLGGGGLIAPDKLELAVAYWKKTFGHLLGVFKTAVRPCAVCKAQLKRVFSGLGAEAQVVGVSELVYRALD
ncbi:MAG: (Fe-S)-binding protein [Pyrobaculum sp.]